MSEWLSTREIAERLGYRDLKWLRRKLLLLGIHCIRIGKGQFRWRRDVFEAVFHEELSGVKRGEAGR